MQNEGFVSSCSDGYCLDRSCPYNAAFGKCLVNDCPANSSTTCTGNTVGQNACGENCKNAATTPARPAIRQRQLPNATTQSVTNAEIPVTKPKTATPARDTTTVAEHGSIVPEPSVIRTLHVAAPTARATISEQVRQQKRLQGHLPQRLLFRRLYSGLCRKLLRRCSAEERRRLDVNALHNLRRRNIVQQHGKTLSKRLFDIS